MSKPRNVQLLTLLAIVFVVVLYYRQPALLEGFEARTYDLRVRSLRAAVKPAASIAIVAIDDKSIAELGRFPWSRGEFTKLLDITTRAGAKAVLFDVIFPETESVAVDGEFAAAVKRAGNVTFPAAFEVGHDGTATGLKKNIPTLQGVAANIAHINVFPDEDGVIRWVRLMIPHGGNYYPSLGLSAAATLLGAGAPTAGNGEVVVGPRHIPVDSEHKMLIE